MIGRLFLFPEEMIRMFGGADFLGWSSSGGQLRNGEVLSGYACNDSAVGFSEFFRGVAGALAEVVAEGWGVPEPAGKGCFCDGAG